MEILKNKSYKDYDYLSRYISFPYYYHSIDEKYIYGITAQLSKENTYVLYKSKANDTYDSIAARFYGNPTFFWVICDFNNIQDPFQNIEIGTEIKIPTINNIKFKMD